ncbi:anaerobic nitric oxide reductase transcription regulator [Panacagrimonas perspica]|uniref:Anaerobic nitric oxide reductase transcription regulator n=1 Tax=Panacagrimonas perspica TaxID=381431 RepID=A0A4R7NYL8_9GAMM|nr:nitric oxide reductase transcriptional regulator NorR [Panacagrimonas perspica]TDU26423.1 anaerobic nitric oxide reductase transcription regulator [Panacagrimonas perspica]
MTANALLLAALLPVVDDLARELPEHERYRRLLSALRALIPCDAVALLRLDGAHLIPLAVEGLVPDTLGRRFRVDQHPRLSALLEQRGPLRFPVDCGLPDPYDGLIEGPREPLEIHDCMGCALRIDDRPWGLVTLDALEATRFKPHELESLEAFARLAAATVKAAERLRTLARRAEDEHRLAEHYREVAAQSDTPEMIGQSSVYRRLLGEIDVVAASELTVLITGETGTGKELVAQAIHVRSPRARRPLVSVNCAALPETLVESELFGHVRGAFSGAVADRRGRFELADGGTLFLDEVGELPPGVQAKLLRVLQSGQLQRVGSDREHRVDVRILAATNRDLAEEVRAGRFRADLYHRLSVYPLRVPPLRERGRDVLLMAGHFLEQNRSRLRVRSLRLTAAAQAALLAHDWPGNVRELEHLIGRASLKARARSNERLRIVSIELQDLDQPAVPPVTGPIASAAAPDTSLDLRRGVDDFQRQQIRIALERSQGNRAAAARALGIDRANLHRLERRLGLPEAAPPKAQRETRREAAGHARNAGPGSLKPV